jgi:intracellular multiplication protein IcmO
MTVFDEVGYYTAQGMAVMAAQARSLGFCLVFSGQDLPAMKKRVREEANSITANCNIKIFGKLEDPTETKEFFEKTVGSAMVTEVSGFQMAGGTEFGSYFDTQQAGVQLRPRASYDELRGFKEGEAVITYGETVVDCKVFYSNPGNAKAMRVTRFMALPPPDDNIMKHANAITKLRDLMVNKSWTAERADVAVETSEEIAALAKGFDKVDKDVVNPVDKGIAAIVQVYGLSNSLEMTPPSAESAGTTGTASGSAGGGLTATPPQAPSAQQTPPPSPLAQKPQGQAAPVQQQQDQAQGQKASANPMGFFGAGKSDTLPQSSQESQAPATPPPSAPAQQTPPPQTEQAAPPPLAQPQQPPQAPPPAQEAPRLPKEIEDIIAKAAQDSKKTLFQDGNE